ncbi:MAG: glutamine amidotransferase, partial [Dokdonella sp.]
MSSRRRIEPRPASRFLIVQTGSTLPELRARRGDFPDWFQRGLRLHRSEVDIARVDLGEELPADVRGYAGVVVTGSPAMVSERLRWSEDTAAWLRATIDKETHVLGVCYGHQLLAHALGGRVDYHPSGREVGTVGIERLAAGADDALLQASPPSFMAHASHQQSVLELPKEAVTLARSAHDPHHAVRYAPRVWGLQFHPEFSVEIMRGYLRRRRMAA